MLPVCTFGASVRQHTGPAFMVLVEDEPNTEGYGSLCVYTQHQKLDFYTFFMVLLLLDMFQRRQGVCVYVVLILQVVRKQKCI